MRGLSNQQRVSRGDFCFSRVSPLQKQRNEQVEMIERALKKHPLALYPHLEECVPPEVSNVIAPVLVQMSLNAFILGNLWFT